MGKGRIRCMKCLQNKKKEDIGDDEEKRDRWGSKYEFILSCIGYCVGLGTIWRFPIVVYQNGGGAFLLPYIIYMFLLGIPLVALELAYGQFSSLSPILVWKLCPMFQGIGYAMILVSGLVSIYCNIIIAWTLYYFVLSFNNPLPWSHCYNSWNTDHCLPKNISEETRANLTAANLPNTTATDEFF